MGKSFVMDTRYAKDESLNLFSTHVDVQNLRGGGGCKVLIAVEGC